MSRNLRKREVKRRNRAQRKAGQKMQEFKSAQAARRANYSVKDLDKFDTRLSGAGGTLQEGKYNTKEGTYGKGSGRFSKRDAKQLMKHGGHSAQDLMTYGKGLKEGGDGSFMGAKTKKFLERRIARQKAKSQETQTPEVTQQPTPAPAPVAQTPAPASETPKTPAPNVNIRQGPTVTALPSTITGSVPNELPSTPESATGGIQTIGAKDMRSDFQGNDNTIYGNVGATDNSVVIQGGGPGGEFSNQATVAASNALNENQYAKSQQMVSGTSTANKFLQGFLSGSGILDTIRKSDQAAAATNEYFGAKADEQQALTFGNQFEIPVWQQPDPLKSIKTNFKKLADDEDDDDS